ncbi:MAG TPA: NADH-quinone oxidoreductase subunit C [Verrucomicrobiae bacterium]|nr:NADH-quinone oxidoreductase subunit C [Verrucomicrobiae bacterium]
MASNLCFETITARELTEKCRVLKTQGYRLVQIGAARVTDQLELTYSFDRESNLLNLRLTLSPTEPTVPSISSVYWCAFLYENEMHDLFGINVQNLEIDFHGSLYRTSVQFPFGATRPPVVRPDIAKPVPPAGQPSALDAPPPIPAAPRP